MDINSTNYSRYNSMSFQNKKNEQNMTIDEKFDIYAVNCAKILSQKAEYEVPENGKFSKPVAVSFEIPGTDNIGYYCVDYDKNEPKSTRRFYIGVMKKDDIMERIVKRDLFKGTKKEILDFLNSSENKKLFIKNLQELSDAAEKIDFD